MLRASKALSRNTVPYFSDTFSRPDGTPLVVNETGQVYSGTTGSFPFDTYNDGGRCTISGTLRAAYFSCAPDVKVRVRFKNMSSTNQSIVIRASSNTRYYRAQFGGNRVRISVRTDAGSTELMFSESITPPTDADEFYFLADGDYLEAGINGVALAWATDETWLTQTGVGWAVNNSTTILCDSITAEPLRMQPVPDFAWSANWATAGLANYSAVVHPETASIVDDPVLGSSRKVLKMVVPNTAIQPTSNPRCQLSPPRNLVADSEFYVGLSFLFPSVGFPSVMPVSSSGFLNMCQLFGPPFGFGGSSPVHLGFRADGTRKLQWLRNDDYNDVPWITATDVAFDAWYDFVIHCKMSNHDDIGFVEMWMNTGTGWQPQLLNGQAKLWMRTQSVGPVVMESAAVDLQMYRKVDMFDTVTAYYGHHAVGHSFEAVAPHSYS